MLAMKHMMLLLLPFATLRLCGQDTVKKKNPYDINIHVTTEQEAHYPQGNQKLYEDVFYHLQYPDEAVQAKVIGTVTLSFVVDPDGTLRDISVLKGVGYGVDEALVRVLKELKFAPAIQNGVKVRSTLIMNFPVSAT